MCSDSDDAGPSAGSVLTRFEEEVHPALRPTHVRMAARELARPTGAVRDVVENGVEPVEGLLAISIERSQRALLKVTVRLARSALALKPASSQDLACE